MNMPLLRLLAAPIALSLAACSQPSPIATASASPLAATGTATTRATTAAADDLVARGEYLVRITGCNDCHTAGYGEAQGEVDKARWLTGSPLGYKGPWGTTYAANLRLKLADMDEATWLDYSGALRTRPIMPDFALRAMSVEDRRAMFAFIKSLGPGGAPAPDYVPPGQVAAAPYFELVLPAAPTAAAAPAAVR